MAHHTIGKTGSGCVSATVLPLRAAHTMKAPSFAGGSLLDLNQVYGAIRCSHVPSVIYAYGIIWVMGCPWYLHLMCKAAYTWLDGTVK